MIASPDSLSRAVPKTMSAAPERIMATASPIAPTAYGRSSSTTMIVSPFASEMPRRSCTPYASPRSGRISNSKPVDCRYVRIASTTGAGSPAPARNGSKTDTLVELMRLIVINSYT